jgi:linoleoyl-CoA desaturase
MKQQHTNQSEPAGHTVGAVELTGKLKFGKNNGFQVELRRRVDEYFRSGGRRQRDCPWMYVKTAILVACFGAGG